MSFPLASKHSKKPTDGPAAAARMPVTDLNGLSQVHSERPCVVVGVDESQSSLRALSYAAGLARRQAVGLLCVYVEHQAAYEYAIGWCPELAQFSQGGAKVPDALRRHLDEQLGPWQMPYQLVGCIGDTALEITRVADSVHAQAVIVGAPRPRTLRLGRSCPARLAKIRRWPLVVIP